MATLLGILLVAGAATLADFIWYSFGVRHSVTSGVLHGALLLTVVGVVLGAAAGRIGRGVPVGAVAGLGGAASYYVIVGMTGGATYGSAIPAAWVILWLLLAALEGRWLRAPACRSWGTIARRGALAAIGSGVAFYLVMNTLWGRPPASGRNYLLQFAAWAFAWAPGLVALTLGGERRVPVAVAAAPRPIAPTVGEAGGAGESHEEPEGSITADELIARIERGDAPPILDVRSEGEFAAGHVPGAINVPFNLVPARLDEVPGEAGRELVVYCGHGPRAYMAAVPLRFAGKRKVVYLSGHWSAWQADGRPIAR